MNTNRRNGKLVIRNTSIPLFTCSQCYKTTYNTDEISHSYYYCSKCNLYYCILCCKNDEKCVQGCKRLSLYMNNDETRLPDGLHNYIPVVKINNKKKYFCFC